MSFSIPSSPTTDSTDPVDTLGRVDSTEKTPSSGEREVEIWPDICREIQAEFLLYGSLGSFLSHFSLALRSIEEIVVTLKHNVDTTQFKPVNGGYEPPAEVMPVPLSDSSSEGGNNSNCEAADARAVNGKTIQLLVTAYEDFARPVVWLTHFPQGCDWATRTEVYFDSVENVYSGAPFLHTTLTNILAYCGLAGNALDVDIAPGTPSLDRTKVSALVLRLIRQLPPSLAEHYERTRHALVTNLLLGHMAE